MTESVPSRRRRFTMVFIDTALDELREMAIASDQTVTEVIRNAVALEKAARRTVAAGGRVILEGADGRQREVLFR